MAAVFTLVFGLTLLIHSSFMEEASTPLASSYQAYRALPSVTPDANCQIVTVGKSDGRALLIQRFFEGYNAPLAKYADTFVEVADRYHLDYRLLPAISMQESNGGKRIPKNSNNPFGYGIYGSKILRFTSFDQAIAAVGQGLRQNYIDRGLKTPSQIMTKYTPPSIPIGGPWAKGVSGFMEELI